MKEHTTDILLIDDNPDDAELIVRALNKNKLNHNLIHLRDGEVALQYLLSCELTKLPKLILLDLKMPKVDGLEVLRKIKSDPNKKAVPIVMLTSSREEQDVIACYQNGANGYIVKPVDFEEFSTAISGIGNFWLELNQPPVFMREQKF